jgi:hypothetical protein
LKKILARKTMDKSQPLSQESQSQKSLNYKDNFIVNQAKSLANSYGTQDFNFLEFHSQSEDPTSEFEFQDFTQLDSQNTASQTQSTTGTLNFLLIIAD